MSGQIAPAGDGDPLHREVVDKLEESSDAQLAKTAAKYPSLVPNGSSGLGWAKDVHPAKSIRAQFEAPPNEETRAVALWTLGVLNADAAIPVAFAVLDSKDQNEHLVASALRVLAHATHDQAEAALKLAALHLQKSKSVYVFSGAQAVLLRSVQRAHGEGVARGVEGVLMLKELTSSSR